MSWRRARFLGVGTALALALSAAPAATAAITTPAGSATTTTTPTPPTTSATPVAASARVTLYLPDAFFVHRQPVTVPNRTFHIVGIARPYIAGQWVLVRTYLGRRLIKSDKLRLKPSRNHRYGQFTEGVASPGVGGITVTVVHAASPELKRFTSQRRLTALDEHVGFGSTGPFVDLLQQRLAALHLYIPQTGVYDQGTGLALDAYHRLLRSGTSQTLDGRTTSFLLDGFGAFKVRFPNHGRHAEGNLSLQLIALVDGSQVYRLYPISSGKPSTPTILGDFQVYSRVPGYLPDGMYYSDFFIRGYAIHGYDPAPDYPASHGCMRLPIVDAISAFNWLALGDWVDVYY
ncbi:MAG TPA: L,D-transpeptidase [Solirubrobacteraceae bacterium]|nr:L,D-transpeptidase [Solirubrobacteraceae bacterium]